MMNKIIITVIILMLAISASVAFYIYKQNSVLHYHHITGEYTLDYPKSYTVTYSSAHNIIIDSGVIDNIHSNIIYTIDYKITDESKTFEEMVKDNGWCTYLSENQGENFTLGGKHALIFKDTPCGEFGSTVIYGINNDKLYEITIESTADYSNIESEVDKILNSFSFVENRIQI